MVDVAPIRTDKENAAALEEIERLIKARPGTPDSDRLDVLVTQIQAYEAERHAVEAPDPIALIQFVMEQRRLDGSDLQLVRPRRT